MPIMMFGAVRTGVSEPRLPLPKTISNRSTGSRTAGSDHTSRPSWRNEKATLGQPSAMRERNELTRVNSVLSLPRKSRRTGVAANRSRTVIFVPGDAATRVTVESGHYNAAYREAYVYIRSASHQRLHGHYSLVVGGQHVVDGGRYNAWMEGQDDAEFKQPSESDTMSIPGDSRKVITVGNYATSTS